MSRRFQIISGLLALLLLAVFWNAVWSDLDRSVLSRVPMLDEAFYLDQGAEIADGHIFPDTPFFMSPLYPYLVAATGSGRVRDENRLIVGGPPTGIRILQTSCWLGVILLLLATGRILIAGSLWWLPAILFLLYRPAAIMASSILLEMPLTFIVTLVLYQLLRLPKSQKPTRDILVIGALIGIAALLRGVAVLVWIPAALVIGKVEFGRLKSVAWKPVIFLTLAVIVVLSPVILHNSYHAGRPAGLSLNLGLNMYLGNGPGANGGFRGLKGFDVETDPAGIDYFARKSGVRAQDLGEADRLWLDETLQHFADHPLEFPRLWLQKLRMHFVGVEFPQISSYESWTRYAPWLRVMFVPWWLLSILGLTGLVVSGWRDPRIRTWSLTLVLLVSVHSVFFVVSRYRLVLVPILVVLATMAITEFLKTTRAQRIKSILVFTIACCAVWPWGYGPLMDQLHAAGLRNEAVRWQHLGSAEKTDPAAQNEYWRNAEDLYRQSKDEISFIPDTYRGLARVLFLLNEPDKAEAALIEGTEAIGNAFDLQDDLARLYLQRGQSEKAVPVLNILLRDDPDNPDLLHNYAVALAGTGRTEQAIEAARRLVELTPGDARGYIDLGVVLARSGRLDEARVIIETGLKVQPDNQSLLHNLQRLNDLK